ncbi:antibiotic biosynthesis monooxygenase family protein [Oceanobacillus massiliensis]|uniref:antibiotic biosynthesis monooxygenase family protein n=1 Tax=Oceanobacillus massiliensis TaxID=1465765 RepID=UPI0002886EED|nr:antibiotic biosynthesis monooxygenase [Oceanobacillus massiliensis]
MKAYMTNGTIDFLQKLDKKHPEFNLHLMSSSESGIAYYENNNKKLFNAGREYELLMQTGEIQKEGFVVMNNIPVADDSKPGFEHRFKNRTNAVEGMPGFQAFRFLRPLQNNTYVVLTQWSSAADFENWKASDQFKEAHKGQAAKQPAHFTERPFITTCTMLEED